MEKLIVAGAGGHCKVVLDIILEDGKYEPVGLLSSGKEEAVLGVPVIGNDDNLEELFAAGVRCGFVAVGSNRIRAKVAKKMREIGYQLITPISRFAVVSRFSKIGCGTVVMPGAVVNAGAEIGEGCILNTNCSVDHDCVLEDYVHIAPGCAVSGFTKIGSGSFLGTGARVIDGIQIGSNIMLGAGAAAISDLPNNCTAVGVPARVIKSKEKA